MFKKNLICLFVYLFISQASANGVSPYLPLKIDPLIELEIERLSSISQMPALTKPYHIVTVVKYLDKIQDKYPTLYQRLNSYIKRYKKQAAITNLSSKLSYSDDKDKVLANSRGQSLDSNITTSGSGFYQINKYAIANIGGTIIDGKKLIPHNSYFSFGYEYLQIDLGYREHWLSPMQESAALLSTNAEPIASITFSNVKAITDFNIKYEMSFGLLEKMDGIHFNKKITSGKPGLLTMHLSMQPFDWWTIGANRTFMFGGGERKISLGDIWNAIKDPVNSDNCGGGTDLVDCDKEVGNQLASITNKFDLNFYDKPFSVYFEYGGEDTKEHQNYQLGNIAYTYGLFLPYITESTSMYIEHSVFHSAWYVHHLYDGGYRNDNVVLGHWWANEKSLKDGSGALLSTLRFNWDINSTNHLEVQLKTVKLDTLSEQQNNRSKSIKLNLTRVYKSGFIGLSVNLGQDTFGNSFSRASVSYHW